MKFKQYFNALLKLAYASLLVVMCFEIQFLISRNAEWQFGGAIMTLWLTSPIWFGVAVSSVLHRNDLARTELIAAVFPALAMGGILLGAYH